MTGPSGRASGFVEAAGFDGSEVADTVLEPLTIFMELDLGGRTPMTPSGDGHRTRSSRRLGLWCACTSEAGL
jgi:hypothetical protein